MTAARTDLAARLNAALPQTQCQRCGYPDCAAYAQAMAQAQAPINQCPPGGAEGVARLAALTGQAPQALNPVHGQEGPRTLAVIDEDWCIGCTLCLDACPVDAILGANKLMHTVIAAHCTGCELCLPACPVDCIAMQPQAGPATQASGWAAWSPAQAQAAAQRYAQRQQRHTRPEPAAARASVGAAGSAAKSSVIAAALARARERQADSSA